MNDQIELTVPDRKSQIINLVIDGLSSGHSKRMYSIYVSQFLDWYQDQNKPGLNKAVVQEYRQHLQTMGFSGASINGRLSAIRKLAEEAADNGLIDTIHANGISRVGGVKQRGTRIGKWLNLDQVKVLLNLPDTSTLKGLRDKALLALMLCSGLRRSEIVNLTYDHVQELDGRWVVVDIIGKGNRLRSVPIPGWAKQTIDDWTHAADLLHGKIFRAVNKGGRVVGEGINPQTVRDVVNYYSEKMGFKFAAHDLRRTYAKLAQKGGAGLDQIQLSLGHASIQTTERYLGVTQSLTDAPCDHLGL